MTTVSENKQWKKVKLENIIELISGQHVDANNYNTMGKGIPYLTGPADFPNGKIIVSKYTENPKAVCQKGDILITVKGSGVGKTVISDDEYCISRQLMAIRVDEELRDFIYYNLKIRENIYNSDSAGLIPGLSRSDILQTFITLPTNHKESLRIGKIIRLWDDVIDLKEKLIEQKKEQKKGLMQKLLTGEIRINGYRSNWREVDLGDICSITTGKLDANAMAVNGRYKFFTCAEEVYSINEYAFDTEALLISGNGANVGYIHYYKGKFNAYQRTYVLSDFSEDILFIKYILDQYLKKRIYREKNAGNMPYITLSTLKDMNLLIPSIEEQNAICDVLVKMDLVIMRLTEELKQTKAQKKGLMQQLLTGKIRVKV